MTQVVLAELSMRYGEFAAVQALNLTVESGKLAALLGPSGCGKTTTLRMIAGLLQPSAGDIRFDGRSVLGVAAERRGAVMVFQKHLLFPHMTVGENVGFGLRMRGESATHIHNKVQEMLARVQLDGYEARRSHELSGGQQQRVALARALVIEPAVLLLDEPLANLDANLRLEMRKLIRMLQQDLQMTTLFVTHDQEEAIMLADRIALMQAGHLLQEGSPQTLYEQPITPAVARFFRNENLLPGVKSGAEVWIELGEAGRRTIAVGNNPAVQATPDGPVWLTVRPEHVTLCTSAGPNCLPVKSVGDAVYMGSHAQMQVLVGEETWQVHLPPDAPLGTAAGVYLPLERIWLMARDPADAGG